MVRELEHCLRYAHVKVTYGRLVTCRQPHLSGNGHSASLGLLEEVVQVSSVLTPHPILILCHGSRQERRSGLLADFCTPSYRHAHAFRCASFPQNIQCWRQSDSRGMINLIAVLKDGMGAICRLALSNLKLVQKQISKLIPDHESVSSVVWVLQSNHLSHSHR